MRALIVVAGSMLGLAGCGGEADQANNTVNVDQAVMSRELAANDVTAIDAVTGDAANIAADVDIALFNALDDGRASSARRGAADRETTKSRPRSSTSAPPRPTPKASAPAEPAAEPPASNSTQ